MSEDGYILTLHRIPRGRHEVKPFKSKKPVALFQHGLLASSDVFLFRGPEHDLRKFKLQQNSKSFKPKKIAAYIMADAGYDVWLSNMRGNIYSNKHQTFDSEKDPEYWKFS